ncbi:MAG TPA: DUF2127 domain-containing protein [Patescibacteria group bacterium]|nr:DUF2127 domain-containing protein [Patescibacteria group bacterium]
MANFFVYKKGTDTGWHVLNRPLTLALVAAYKAVWGLTEVIGGILVLFSSRLIAGELMEDPQDLLANWLLRHVHLSQQTTLFIGITAIVFGVGKLLLALGLWFEIRIIRPLAILFFCGIALFGLREIFLSFSWFKFAALCIDAAILFYLWKILPKHFRQQNVA